MVEDQFRIAVTDEGEGDDAVLFLHGYLETMDIWQGFYESLLPHYRVIRLDLPGHGESGVLAETHSMDIMALLVDHCMKYLGVTRCVIVGHSLGGYVALACMEQGFDWVAGVCLLHSSPLPDDEKKRRARDKEIRLVNEGKLSLICHFSIPNAFAEANLKPLADKVLFARELALRSPEAGVTAMLRGMRDRPDRQDVLRDTDIPTLFILGRHDTYVDCNATVALAATFPTAETVVLENTAHSGYFEEPENTLQAILRLLQKVYK